MNSYKITKASAFQSEGPAPLVFGGQAILPGTVNPPSTTINLSRDTVQVEDFVLHDIQHEYDFHIDFRLNNEIGSQVIRIGKMRGFYSKSREMLVLSGKKKDVLSFCWKSKNLDGLKLETLRVDIPKLEKKLTNIRMVWGKNRSGTSAVQARALSGFQLETSSEYAALKKGSDLICITFHFEDQPVMVTEDGTVVLQAAYNSKSEELSLVLRIHDEVLKDFISVRETKRRD